MGQADDPVRRVEPMADLNEAQKELDRVNTELGFLNPQGAREDHGKISTRDATGSGRKSGC
jgi:hypothetical protein